MSLMRSTCLQPFSPIKWLVRSNLEQFSALLKSVDCGLGLAASQLWKEGVDTEVLLRKVTKQDVHEAGINLANKNTYLRW